jgi:hypothetical protein
MHRLDVEIEREVPILVGTIEHGAVMHEARAIHQDVRAAEVPFNVPRQGLDSGMGTNVERPRPFGCETRKLSGLEIGGDDMCAFRGKRFGDGTSNALSGGSDDGNLALQTMSHAINPESS